MRPTGSPEALGIGPADWVPATNGVDCACGHGELLHRPRTANGKPKGPERQDCLYCRCPRYTAQPGLGL